MASKKIINTIIGVSGIIFIILNIIYFNNTGMFYVNLFRQTDFETKNFIIDLPKFYWAGNYMEDNNSEQLFFFGVATSAENSKKGIFPRMYLFNSDNVNRHILRLETSCDKSLEKTTKKINNWEADIYTCIGKNDSLDTYIIYKDEVFHYYYSYDKNVFENFQKQYDKFFEGVRLKG
jgi:hypothetical protein